MKYDTYKNQRQVILSDYKGTWAYNSVQTMFGQATILLSALTIISLFI